MTSEFEPIVTEAYPTPLLPNILVALEWPNRTIPEFPEGIESANIVVLLINSELQTLATHVGLDAVKIIPSVEE